MWMACWRAGYETLGQEPPALLHPAPRRRRRPLTLEDIGLGDDVITTTEATVAFIVSSLPFCRSCTPRPQ